MRAADKPFVMPGGRVSLQELRRARDHGVTRGFIQRVKNRGYGQPSLDEVIRLRDRGLD